MLAKSGGGGGGRLNADPMSFPSASSRVSAASGISAAAMSSAETVARVIVSGLEGWVVSDARLET